MIRYVAQKDESVIYKLFCELEGTNLDKEGFHEAYRDYMKDGKIYCLVAEMDREVAGVLDPHIGTVLCRHGKIGGTVELTVRSGMRFQGIGHGLSQGVYHVVQEVGCARSGVSTSRTRLGAHRFYEGGGVKRSYYRLTRYFSVEK